MLPCGVWGFITADDMTSLHLTRDVRCLLSETGVEAQFWAYVLLLNGLHCVFSCRIGHSRIANMTAIHHGLTVIHQSFDHIAQFPLHDKLLFRAAFKMSEMLMRFGSVSGSTDAIVSIIHDFSGWYRKHLKHIKWRVHENLVPWSFRTKGMLEKMRNVSLMKDEELGQYLVVDTLEIEETAEGNHHLL